MTLTLPRTAPQMRHRVAFTWEKLGVSSYKGGGKVDRVKMEDVIDSILLYNKNTFLG